MIRSMTGFGRAVTDTKDYTVIVEIRSVNSRYFDCTCKITRGYQFLEEPLKTWIQNHAISRGKIEVSLSYKSKTQSTKSVRPNIELAKSYLQAMESIKRELHLRGTVTLQDLLREEGLFVEETVEMDPEELFTQIEPTLREAASQFSEMRNREGKKTEEDFLTKLETIRQLVGEIEELSKTAISSYKEKFEARLRTILEDHSLVLDENRILTECGIFADRVAIDEELVRLKSHMAAFVEICKEPVPSGKKLDFLMQELNRETNTIGSKCNQAEIAHRVVSIKNELEKIREQIQNIE